MLELITRDGSTNELALLVAEFGLLDGQLTQLAAALEGGGGAGAGVGVGAGGTALAVAAGGLLADGDALAKLAADIPDMRARVGIA